ncbi:uncharacterized protein LOC108086660 [Drosophila ficusphila]|uniref:uncharacterized protein LOC108086660 n=1 Tax=Drosophila ficusphila TaxID=30025 RepID=UPI0007E6F1CF|nr:uncharacterized protein LOC108086660 [Drosophila ficusphila]
MPGYQILYACRYCTNVISTKSFKVNETFYDLLLTKTFNLIQEDKIMMTDGDKFQNLFCSKCGMELGMFCLESQSNAQMTGLSLIQKAHLVVYDSYELPFEMPSSHD